MSYVDESSPAYRLGVAMSHIRVLLGEFGPPHPSEIECARAFLKSEDDIIKTLLYGIRGETEAAAPVIPERQSSHDGRCG